MDMFDLSASAQRHLTEKRQARHASSAGLFNIDLVPPKTACSVEMSPIEDHSDQMASSDIDNLVEGLSRVQMPALVLGVQSDLLFPHWQHR